MPYTQENRRIALATPLGADELLLSAFSGQEGVSQLYRFDLEMVSESESIGFDALIGQNATVRISLGDGTNRFLNGHISRFSQGGRDANFTSYNAELVPWLWFLTRTANCRIFQKKKTPDIIQEVFTKLGFNDFSIRLYGDFAQREYCVQYRETDFNFVSRLMEEEGIYYFFEHENGRHTLVLANSPSEHKPCPKQEKTRYEGTSGGTQKDDVVLEWRLEQELRPGQYALNDYNFETPTSSLAVNVSGRNTYEIYDYPGEYEKRADGDELVRVRLQEAETPYRVAFGVSDCRAFSSGYRFSLMEHYRGDQNQDYVITSVHHAASQGSDFRSGANDDDFHYQNTFECIPHTTPFRPARITPHPRVQGSQTAVVVGPDGEEIFTDNYGRVKVQFHWDREGQSDENSSCWIRVSQAWAGKNWGAITLPRIGQEVIVDFLEGDPDRPIITGRVYNAGQMPPYPLSTHKTRSTMKSYSSPGGGGFNEFRFEDKKGEEQIFLHAQKNQDIRVKNDAFETIDGERHLKVVKDRLEEVHGDQHLQIKGDHNQKIDGTVSLNAGMDVQEKVGMKYALDAGTEIYLKSGMNLVIESGMTLTLKVGGNFININPGGVFISGTLVMINSGGAAGSGAGCSPQAPKPPKEADKAEPGEQSKVQKNQKRPVKPVHYSPTAIALKQASTAGAPFCDI